MSRVALEMRSFRSGLNLAMSFTRPNRISVCKVLSWASSMMTTLIQKMKIIVCMNTFALTTVVIEGLYTAVTLSCTS